MASVSALSTKDAPGKAMPPNPNPYLVHEGQSWDDIAQRHNTSAEELKKLNPEVTDLKAGMRVKVK